MFDAFEDECKQAMNEARREAQRLGSGWLDAEHILLGLLRVSDSTALRMLAAVGLDFEAVRTLVQERMPSGGPALPSGQMPFTVRAKRVLELCLEEAADLGDSHVGTEHLLIAYALVAEEEPTTYRGVIDADVHRLRWALTEVPRGLRGSPPSAARGADAAGSAPQKLLAAARICDRARDELILNRHFEYASRSRDLAHGLRKLAGEVSSHSS